MDREAGAGRGANRIAVGPETGKLVATGRSVQMATVLALGGPIVYHDGDVRTNHRPQGNRRPRGTAGRLLGATEDRNKTLHGRRACVRM